MARRAFVAILVVVLGGLSGLAVHLAIAKGDTLFSGTRPENLGVRDGRFASCGVNTSNSAGPPSTNILPIRLFKMKLVLETRNLLYLAD